VQFFLLNNSEHSVVIQIKKNFKRILNKLCKNIKKSVWTSEFITGIRNFCTSGCRAKIWKGLPSAVSQTGLINRQFSCTVWNSLCGWLTTKRLLTVLLVRHFQHSYALKQSQFWMINY